jgi:hypothetical protein
MKRSIQTSILAVFLATPVSFAQVTATYDPFGAGCSGTGSGLGGYHVLPASLATRFGSSDNSIPFTWSPVKYQQVFLGTDLPSAFTMAGLSLRQNDRSVHAHGLTVDLDIRIGYTTHLPSTMSTTFATNFDSGTPVTVLPRTMVVFPDQPVGGPTSPADFFFTIPWPVYFPWAPAPGLNFLVQVTVYGNSNGNQIWGYPLDAGYGQTARLYGSPASATTGVLEPNYGLVLCVRELTNRAVPVLDSKETPQIGNQFPVRVSHARVSSFALLLLGLSNTNWNGIPLPFDLGPVGAPGCSLLASGNDLQFMSTNAAGAGSFTYDIPNEIYVLGAKFYNQCLVADPGTNGLGYVTTNGCVGVLGNQ